MRYVRGLRATLRASSSFVAAPARRGHTSQVAAGLQAPKRMHETCRQRIDGQCAAAGCDAPLSREVSWYACGTPGVSKQRAVPASGKPSTCVRPSVVPGSAAVVRGAVRSKEPA